MIPSFFQRKTTLALAAGAILVAGVAAGYWRYTIARDRLAAALGADAQRCAIAFDPTELQALSGSASDLDVGIYAKVKDRLARLRRADPRVRLIYLCRRLPHTGALVLLASSGRSTGGTEPQPGAPYPEPSTSFDLDDLTTSAGPLVRGPHPTESDLSVTAFALVGGPAAGRALHVLGLDFPADEWHRTLWSAGLGTAGYVWMLLLLPLASAVSTQRQAIQGEALRNLTEAMEQGHSPIMIVDLGLRIEYANARFCRLLGYSRRELIGREWREIHGGHAPEVLADLVTTLRAGRPWTGEWMMPRKDGTRFPLRGGVTPVKNRHGQTHGFVGVFEDMTEVRQTEAVLREAKERAEAGDRAKGRFLATMSHEVRTPLNGIVGFASLLLETPLTPEQREYVDTIRLSSETLIQLTSDILDYARIESGRLKLEPQACDPRECIESALDLVAAVAQQKGIELLHSVDASVPAAISADVGRLRQVLVNLVGNAVKFTAQGEVEVRVRTLEVRSEPPDAAPLCTLEFSVRDTGIGIAPEHHARMFRPFSQADESTTRRFGGTGLGLAICKTIVELMDGSISFLSEPGQGSTFVFTIRVPVHADATAAGPAPSLHGKTVAAAVPSAGLRAELDRVGAALGLRVVHLEPPALASQSGWDIGIVDVSPTEAAELATTSPPRPGLPPARMIALVPMLLPAELRGPLRHHFRFVLNKPVHHDALVSALGAAAQAEMPPSLPTAGGAADAFNLRVMIVEDNPVNQRLIQRIVSHLGCTWKTALNGRQAIDDLPQFQPDVVLMDLHMPELDGLATTLSIRSGEAGEAVRDVWIIALTADARHEQRERTLAAGANDYLTKPVRSEELKAAFLRFLATGRRAS